MINKHGIRIHREPPSHAGYSVVNRGIMGKPGPQHVRELQPRASKPMPSGNGSDAPTTGFRGHAKEAPMQRERKEK